MIKFDGKIKCKELLSKAQVNAKVMRTWNLNADCYETMVVIVSETMYIVL